MLAAKGRGKCVDFRTKLDRMRFHLHSELMERSS